MKKQKEQLNTGQSDYASEEWGEKFSQKWDKRVLERESAVKRKPKQTSQNPYAQMFEADMQFLAEYHAATSKYSTAGVNLKWPYSFARGKSL